MSGIGIIIPNSDFSNSPLGTVSLVKTPTEIVEAYLTRVGANNDYKDKLITLYTTLKQLDVIDHLDIFPMLGSSLSNKLIGLKEQGKAYLFDSLLVGDNASNATDGVTFADSAPNVDSLVLTEKEIENVHGYYCFWRIKTFRKGQGNANEAYYKTSSGTKVWMMTNTTGDYKSRAGISRRNTVNAVDTPVDIYNTDTSVSSYVGSDVINTYQSGVLSYTESINSADYALVLNNLFGAAQGDTSSHFFNANVRMLAFGSVPSDKVAAVDAAFRAYWE